MPRAQHLLTGEAVTAQLLAVRLHESRSSQIPGVARLSCYWNASCNSPVRVTHLVCLHVGSSSTPVAGPLYSPVSCELLATCKRGLKNEHIQTTPSPTNLNVQINDPLTCSNHVSKINRNNYALLHSLKSMKKKLIATKKKRHLLVLSLIFPSIGYCYLVCSYLTCNLSVKVQRRQKLCKRHHTPSWETSHLIVQHPYLNRLRCYAAHSWNDLPNNTKQ
ncbi:hypothetical protein PR048_007653, partial [Dryococelus australis]